MGTAYQDMMARDNAALMDSEESEEITFARPATEQSKPLRAILERGNLSRGKDIRDYSAADRRVGTVFLLAADLSEFGGAPKYRDTVTDAAGETWTVMEEVARDAGIIEASMETDMRPGF